jgi:hypothetical protein
VAGAKLTLRQTSVGSSDARTIWEGTTDSRGEFSGRTREWRRTIRFAGREGADPADLLALSMRIELNGQSAVRPFVYVADFVPSPPLVASWMPPNAVVARINGRDCYTVAEVARQCVELMRRPSAVDIEIPEESLLTPSVAQSANQANITNRLIEWWFTEFKSRLEDVRDDQKTAMDVAQRGVGAVIAGTQRGVGAAIAGTHRGVGAAIAGTQRGVGAVQTAMQQGIGAVLTATQQRVGAARQKLGSQQAESGERLQKAQSAFAVSVLISTLQIICAVVGVVLTVSSPAGAASLAINAAVIAMVAAIGIVGVVTAPPVVRAVVQIARQVGGPSLDLVEDATVITISIVLLVALVFMLAGRHGFEWAKTTVLGGRRGWKIRLS